jgi:hypothetical protein
MHVNVNVQTNSLSKLPKCKGGLVSVFRKIDGLVDAKRRPWQWVEKTSKRSNPPNQIIIVLLWLMQVFDLDLLLLQLTYQI